MSKYKWNNIQGVGLGIVAFEGTEHLVNIITEIRECVDYVVVGLQRKSYHGDPIEPVDLNEIFRLRDEDHLVDEILEIELDTTKLPRVQETDKRNMLIQNIEDHGCSHALIIDSDEFYTKNAILKGLIEIDKNKYPMTYCQYVNYYHDYKHYLVYPFEQGMYVPFISETKYRHDFECKDFPLPSDPTRRYVRPYDSCEDIKLDNGKIYKKKHYTVDYFIFPWNLVKMHHLSCIRADIRKKFNDWSSKTCFENYNDLIDKAVDAYNNFDENSTEEQWAHLLFNTPEHKVKVHAFPKQYINPKYDINTRLRPVKKYKRIAIMDLCSTNSNVKLFEELDKCCKETWAKDVIAGKYNNIDYWTVIDCKEDSHLEEDTHTIYIKTDYSIDNTQQLLDRWLESYKLLSAAHQYDWILRTNTSTWCNIELLNEFLASEDDDSKIYTFKLFSAFYSTFNIHCSGAAMLWPTRNIPILQDIVDKTDKKTLNITLDDVMMSALWRKRAQTIKLMYPDDCFCSLEGDYLNDIAANINFDNVDITVPIYQIKTFKNYDGEYNNKNSHEIRLKEDIDKMRKLQDCWESKKTEYSLDDLATALRNNLNKTINVIPYSKDLWINTLTDSEKCEAIFSKVMPYNEETLQYIDTLAENCGYKHIKRNIKKQ